MELPALELREVSVGRPLTVAPSDAKLLVLRDGPVRLRLRECGTRGTAGANALSGTGALGRGGR